MKSWIVVAGAGLVGLVGCSQPKTDAATTSPAQPEAATAPTTDLSTPDRALKSLFALGDAARRRNCELAKQFYSSKDPTRSDLVSLLNGADPTPELTTGQAKIYASSSRHVVIYCTETTLRREVNEVKTETESRAVALYKVYNETTLPEPYKPYESEYDKPREAQEYKATFTKVDGRWLLEDLHYKIGGEWVSRYADGKELFISQPGL